MNLMNFYAKNFFTWEVNIVKIKTRYISKPFASNLCKWDGYFDVEK